MMFFILILSAYVAMASTEDCPADVDSLPLSEICKSSANSNGIECVPFELRISEGCFKTRFYPKANWVTTKVPWKKQKRLMRSLKRFVKYVAGDNDMGAQLNITLPFVFKFKLKEDLPKNVRLSFYLPSNYQDDPPEPNSPKIMVYQSHPQLVYLKPISFSFNENSTLESVLGSYKELYEELKKAHIYDVDWDHHLIFGYCSLYAKSCRLEIAFMQRIPIPPAPFDKVCKSNTMPLAHECFRGEGVAVDGTDGLVEERKYPEVTVIRSFALDGNFRKAFKNIAKYSYGANAASTEVPIRIPYASFHGMKDGTKYEGVAIVPKTGFPTPKPNNDKVLISTYKESKLYVLAFGGKIKNYVETFAAYCQKLSMLLDNEQISYMEDLCITLDYSHPKDEYQRHEVAVVASEYDYGDQSQ